MKSFLLTLGLAAGFMLGGLGLQSARADHGFTNGGCYQSPNHHHHHHDHHYSSGYRSYQTPYSRAAYYSGYSGLQRVPQVIVVPGGYSSGFGYSSHYAPRISPYGVGPSMGIGGFGVGPTYGLGTYGGYPGAGYGRGFSLRIGF